MEQQQFQSSLKLKFNPNERQSLRSSFSWLDDKREVDGAEGFWRIHDSLYDVSKFVKQHPGGEFWLNYTKGLDITEAFESYHISTKAEEILKKYYVRKAQSERSVPYTFKENGFYKTVKRKVRQELPNIRKQVTFKTNLHIDAAMLAAFTTAIIATTVWSGALGILSGLLFSMVMVAAHNYYHKKDNFRMLYTDVALGSSREARVFHILSHHMFPNSVADFQIYFAEPLMQFYPHKKSIVVKYLSWIYGPFLMWPIAFHLMAITRLYGWLCKGDNRSIGKADLASLILPTSMYLLSGQTFLSVLGMWCFIIAVCGVSFILIGTATSHLHPEIFLDGDQPRTDNDTDWGLAQLDTCADKIEVNRSRAFSLFAFGDHAIHHLFPSLDHAYLPLLYPIVEETLKEFNVEIKMMPFLDIFKGFFKRLILEVPNPNPPSILIN